MIPRLLTLVSMIFMLCTLANVTAAQECPGGQCPTAIVTGPSRAVVMAPAPIRTAAARMADNIRAWGATRANGSAGKSAVAVYGGSSGKSAVQARAYTVVQVQRPVVVRAWQPVARFRAGGSRGR